MKWSHSLFSCFSASGIELSSSIKIDDFVKSPDAALRSEQVWRNQVGGFSIAFSCYRVYN